jgi:hypothetical protein
MNDFNRCFEMAFLGNSQAIILHKFHIGNNIWHVCTIDKNQCYCEGWYRLDSENWQFELLANRPADQ